VIALPVKDPFHLPRALIYAEDALAALGDDPAVMTWCFRETCDEPSGRR